MEVASGIHRLSSGVPNFYVVEEAGKLALVDAGAAGDWNLFVQALQGMGRQLGDLEAVLVTHAHSDHTGFAERARITARATVWIHQDDQEQARGAKPAKNDRGLAPYLLKPE